MKKQFITSKESYSWKFMMLIKTLTSRYFACLRFQCYILSYEHMKSFQQLSRRRQLTD